MTEDTRAKWTRERLREVFLDVMREKPFENITVTELAQRADVSRRAFYSHYEDIYALVADCFRTNLLVDYSKPVTQFDSPEEFVESALEYYRGRLRFCQENTAFARLVYETSPTSLYLSMIPTEGIATIANTIDDIQPPQSPVRQALFSSEAIARVNYLGAGYLMCEWIRRGMKEPVELMANRMAYLAFHLSDIFSANNGACAQLKQAVLANATSLPPES